MAQSIFDSLSSVSLDSSAVQLLLQSQTIISEVVHSAINQDEEDIFQCGICKCQFTSLHLFVLHKREHANVPEEAVDLNQYLVNQDSHVTQTDDNCHDDSEYNLEDDFNQAHELGDSNILEDNDILFSMEHEGSSYLNSDSSFNVPIILSSDGLENFATSSLTGTDEDHLSEDFNDFHNNFNDIIENPESSDAQQAISSDVQPVENSTEISEQEDKSDQPRNFKYKCNYCNKQFAKKFYWQQHERSHTGEKPYQCVVCGRPFAQKSNVKKHMSSHKVWPGTAIHSLPPEAPPDGSIERSYHCQFCREIFDSYKALKAHLIVSHWTLKVYKCVQYGCGSMFAELEDFLEHTRSHKLAEYRCHVCADTFTTLSDLGLHQYTHSVQKQKTTEKYYCCSICKSSFSNLEALQNHMETTTHDYICPHCGKSFLIERFLRRHLKTHATSSRFICEDCGKAFKTEQYLANHKLIHSKETPYLCPYCPSAFKRKDRLGRHMLIHDLTKRLKCPYRTHSGACAREFSRADKLKRHLLTHSNAKRYTCSLCDQIFPRPNMLRHHEINKHGFNFKCDGCSHLFKNKDQMASHNCEAKKQRPKKASGSFKPRRPTPKRQLSSSKSSAGSTTSTPEKEKLKNDEKPKKNIPKKLKRSNCMNDFDGETEETGVDLDLSNDSSLTIDT